MCKAVKLIQRNVGISFSDFNSKTQAYAKDLEGNLFTFQEKFQDLLLRIKQNASFYDAEYF